MKQSLFTGTNSYGPALIRLFLSLVLFPHGAQKLLGWFGGFGFGGTMNYFTSTVGLPWIVGFLVILLEFFGPVALLLGWFTRYWSFALILVFTGIIATVHHDYFFMNWFGSQKGEGAEFFLLAIGMSASLVLSGSGNLSVDHLLQNKIKP
ncbi:MAG TPA: DoxX family protein [Flavisolibacter sp.]|jgi:putative oxidoreductase|nr:DoxX family protein [Flavisolibacter sp.]